METGATVAAVAVIVVDAAVLAVVAVDCWWVAGRDLLCLLPLLCRLLLVAVTFLSAGGFGCCGGLAFNCGSYFAVPIPWKNPEKL
ncbi:hypothetical protein NDU88_008344 [Pleurodeles waltl]|uniref:Secreted peptide n=1 Tax=Pleurodeles waltl TaxID=8319 RepID=A0AAV7RXE7_PLEWA|nr:hypothetical protein NDU88_008344 [Pleurodeles waltl]